MTEAHSRKASPEFSFCEPGNAVAMGKIHIRAVGAGQPARGAGLAAGTAALCGRHLDYGWDLDGDVTAHSVAEQSKPRPRDGHVWLCRGCVDAYKTATADLDAPWPAPATSDLCAECGHYARAHDSGRCDQKVAAPDGPDGRCRCVARPPDLTRLLQGRMLRL